MGCNAMLFVDEMITNMYALHCKTKTEKTFSGEKKLLMLS